ncbi:hypothetical protein DFH11DRAFT_1518867 [Phellopilus nigrolimitatus]|nr:hypothetical protein DFH11DRAFT_1518867 [Phellopilus nigrolimitatus]
METVSLERFNLGTLTTLTEVSRVETAEKPLPCTPNHTPKRTGDASIDPSLYTPSKHMRLMTGSLAMSSSGSFLVSSAKCSSSDMICAPVLEQPPDLPEPDWSLVETPVKSISLLSREELEERMESLTGNLKLAHNHIQAIRSINEGANAQLVIQDLYAAKLKTALHEKDKKKSTDKTKMFEDGHGKVFTSNEVVQFISDREAAKVQEGDETAQRAKDRKSKQTAKETQAERWEEIKRDHAADVQQWETNCERWGAEGLHKRDWVSKPKRMKKPGLKEFEATAMPSAVEEGQSDGECSENDDGEH